VSGLENIPLFHGLGAADLAAARAAAQLRRFAAGEIIFPEGSPGDGVWFVKSGLVEIFSGAGGRKVFSRLGPGEIFGEMSVVEDKPRSAAAAAALGSEAWFLPREKMRALLEHSPGLAFALLQHISRRLRDFNAHHVRELVQAESLAVIGKFAQGIIHDLKNPLSIISLSAEMFTADDATPEFCAETRQRIRQQVRRINDLVGDVLIFTEGKRADARFFAGDYRAFVLGLLPDLRADAKLKAVEIVLENEPPAVTVRIEPRRLARVFFNLCGNAVDIMPDGGKIFLRCSQNGNEILTEIEDTGPGIAPEIAGQLFQPFATHGKSKGTGLGLSICKKIVEDHGGKISARGEPGRGAIFAFTLPLAK
jgi:signal transduction histidine kinase